MVSSVRKNSRTAGDRVAPAVISSAEGNNCQYFIQPAQLSASLSTSQSMAFISPVANETKLKLEGTSPIGESSMIRGTNKQKHTGTLNTLPPLLIFLFAKRPLPKPPLLRSTSLTGRHS